MTTEQPQHYFPALQPNQPPESSVCRVLSHDIDVQVVDPDLWAQDELGRALLSKSRVLISNQLQPDTLNSTILHELTHIISDLLTLDLSEQQVDGVAIGFHSIIRDNPEFVRRMLR